MHLGRGGQPHMPGQEIHRDRVKSEVGQHSAKTMTKSELVEILAGHQAHLTHRDVEIGVTTMLEHVSETLASGGRIEIRGFGSFTLSYRPPRIGRNPKSGESVALPARHVPRFKPGKELRERVMGTG